MDHISAFASSALSYGLCKEDIEIFGAPETLAHSLRVVNPNEGQYRASLHTKLQRGMTPAQVQFSYLAWGKHDGSSGNVTPLNLEPDGSQFDIVGR